jgi:exosortase A
MNEIRHAGETACADNPGGGGAPRRMENPGVNRLSLVSTAVPQAEGGASWRAVCWALVGATVVLVLAFADTWAAMVRVWSESETFNHGFAVAPISLWLVWRARDAVRGIAARPSGIGLLALAGCCVVWMIGQASGVNVVAAFAAVASIPALVMAVAGVRTARAIAFPLGFLFFMVPAGEGLTPWLMEATADATIWAVAASGVPVFREGLHFTLPSGRWSVVEACSGLRYVIAAAVLSSLFAYLNFRRWRPRLMFVAIALAVSLVANWVRAYLIVMIGHLSGMRLGVGDDHVFYGWVFFGLTMLAVFWMGARWREDGPVAGSPRVRSEVDRGDADRQAGRGPSRILGAAAVAAAMLVLAPLGLDALRRDEPRIAAIDALSADLRLRPGEPVVVPRFAGSRRVVQGALDTVPGTDLYVAYYAGQRRDEEMVAFGNTVLDSGDRVWGLLTRSDRSAGVTPAIPVRELIVSGQQGRRILWSWYTVGGVEARGEMAAKALTAAAILRGRGDHSTVAVVGTRLDDGGSGPPSDDALRAARARLDVVAVPLASRLRAATGP